jgi:hypothetical protein
MCNPELLLTGSVTLLYMVVIDLIQKKPAGKPGGGRIPETSTTKERETKTEQGRKYKRKQAF